MGSTPTPIVQYWHSPERPAYIADRMASFSRLNPMRPHLIFDEQSAAEFIAERFGRQELAAFRACGPPAMQADYLRCCAILKLGVGGRGVDLLAKPRLPIARTAGWHVVQVALSLLR